MTFFTFELFGRRRARACLRRFWCVLAGARVISESQSGLVVKRFGPPLSSGRIIALNGEAGYQARMLSPGLALRVVALEVQGREGAGDRRPAR